MMMTVQQPISVAVAVRSFPFPISSPEGKGKREGAEERKADDDVIYSRQRLPLLSRTLQMRHPRSLLRSCNFVVSLV